MLGSKEHPDIRRRALDEHWREERRLLEAATREMNQPIPSPPGSADNPLIAHPNIARAIRSEFPDVHVVESELNPPSRGWR